MEKILTAGNEYKANGDPSKFAGSVPLCSVMLLFISAQKQLKIPERLSVHFWPMQLWLMPWLASSFRLPYLHCLIWMNKWTGRLSWTQHCPMHSLLLLKPMFASIPSKNFFWSRGNKQTLILQTASPTTVQQWSQGNHYNVFRQNMLSDWDILFGNHILHVKVAKCFIFQNSGLDLGRKHTVTQTHTHSKICTCWSGSSRTATQRDKQFAQWIHSTLCELLAGGKCENKKNIKQKNKEKTCWLQGVQDPRTSMTSLKLFQRTSFGSTGPIFFLC